MFSDVGVLELATLVVLALVLYGPDKLPEAIRTVSAVIRKFREFSEDAKRDVRDGLGPEFEDFEFEDLHPRTFVRKHLLDGDGAGFEGIRDALDPRPELKGALDAVRDTAGAEGVRDSPAGPGEGPVSPRKGEGAPPAGRPPVDPDAT
ncbi:sec-independent translocase [[Kitasatospora] papulosa]|uniref:sec-independent translocase n=1 Tax=Streptomyces TaxID=1883 RepID=UPI000ACD3EBA|nr:MULTISPECIES: sec-independent translocase [unclassified Streptomyces]MBD2831056.1 Sec-independent protein translocase subunit TatB [Streptomyces pratensis]MDF6061223.1 sec-independent translocase [Streptomyces sp. JH010]MDF9873699.1 sec-independent protein translocase protein TatB [Streptomyces pratensis]MDX3185568.1 sec-independent translocase [Streptomyces sp. ME02-7008A-1]MDX3306743.1 sec-independent translocase [Streptomyces sp. ME02-7008A]